MDLAFLSASWTGPLPHPDVLARYDEVVPGSARERVDAMHEERAERHAADRELRASSIRSNENDQPLRRRGQILAFLICVSFSGVAVLFAYRGMEAAATTIIGTTLLGVVAAFLGSRVLGGNAARRQTKEEQ